MAANKGAAVIPSPRRYDDIAFDEHEPISGPATGAAVKQRVESRAPASAMSGGVNPVPDSFERNMREDDGGKPDIQPRKPSVIMDPVSHQLGLGLHEERAIFHWHRDSAGREVPFSRRYWEEDVLVDLFRVDAPYVREEIAGKRAAIIAHNAKAKEMVEALRVGANERAARRFEAAKALGRSSKTLEEYQREEFEASYVIAKRNGDVPFGYAPIVNNLRDIDGGELKKGAVFDLAPVAVDEWVPVGAGIRASKHE